MAFINFLNKILIWSIWIKFVFDMIPFHETKTMNEWIMKCSNFVLFFTRVAYAFICQDFELKVNFNWAFVICTLKSQCSGFQPFKVCGTNFMEK